MGEGYKLDIWYMDSIKISKELHASLNLLTWPESLPDVRNCSRVRGGVDAPPPRNVSRSTSWIK